LLNGDDKDLLEKAKDRFVSVYACSGEQGIIITTSMDTCNERSNHYRCELLSSARENLFGKHGNETTPEGLIFNLFDQYTGNIIFTRVFPLIKFWAHWSDLQWHIEHTSPGRIAVFTMSSSGLRGLREAKKILSDLGSVFSKYLKDSSTWVWIFIIGGKTLLESTM
ncbi:unnamed protein product, partial [Meganyctiphanes norvegica]